MVCNFGLSECYRVKLIMHMLVQGRDTVIYIDDMYICLFCIQLVETCTLKMWIRELNSTVRK